MLIYFLNLLLIILASPYLYFVIRKLRRTIPSLPNAQDLLGKTTGYDEALSLLLLGESAIAGVGVGSNHDALAGHISNKLSKQCQLNVSWEILAHTGYHAEQVLDILLPQLRSYHYDIILIQLAANDAFRLNFPNRYKTSIEKIIHHLRAKYPEAIILFINNPPVRDMAFPAIVQFVLGNIMDQYAKVLHDLAAKDKKVFFIDDKVRLKDWRRRFPDRKFEDFFSDGVHPSAFTFSVWAEDICDYMMNSKIINVKKPVNK